ncbi:C-type lectin domain-containing protein [Lachnospiraceae bacterium C1.1]|nr:C-type lectin domain-containing protein [Lachnospiraceae bacterium C1.1]
MKKKDVISFAAAIGLVLVATVVAVVLIMTENNAEKKELAEETEFSTEEASTEVVSGNIVSGYVASTDEDEEAVEEFEEGEAAEDQWISDYRYVLEKMTAEEYPNNALIYIDDDDVPEMVLLGNESRIYTWHDGIIDFIELDKDSFIFSEYGNLLTTNGIFYKIKQGEFEETDDTIEEKDKAYLLETYSYDQLEEMLKSSNVSANAIERTIIPEEEEDEEEEDVDRGTFDADDDEIHTYEFVVGDYSWTQAYESVQMDGDKRYLARITSEEEFLYVSNLIKESNLQNYQFWIGATRDEDSEEYHWLNNFGEFSKKAITKDGIYEGAWASGEPSFKGNGDTETDVEETCLMMFYDLDKNVFQWKDVPNKILSTSPSLAGKIGYIIESEGGSDEDNSNEDE